MKRTQLIIVLPGFISDDAKTHVRIKKATDKAYSGSADHDECYMTTYEFTINTQGRKV